MIALAVYNLVPVTRSCGVNVYRELTLYFA